MEFIHVQHWNKLMQESCIGDNIMDNIFPIRFSFIMKLEPGFIRKTGNYI